MGEIAEALKRSREEREAKQPSTGPEAPRQPSASSVTPPGRSELLAALEAAQAEDAASARTVQSSTPDAAPRAEAVDARMPPGSLNQESLHEIAAEALESIGKPDMHRQLALQVATQLEARSARSLSVVSAMRDEGKTTVACTLAIALASVTAQRCVALVDLDLRNPSIGRRLMLPKRLGIEQYLYGKAGLDEIRIPIAAPMLDVFPSVEPQRAAHELLARPQLGQLIRELERRYTTIIIDTPPTLIVPDASLLLKQGPCCVTVARSGTTRVRRFEEMLDILPANSIVGKVLNSASMPGRDKDYYEYNYRADEDETVGERTDG